jgi:hypothetical protein
MPLLGVDFGVFTADRGVLVRLEKLEDPGLLLPLGFLLLELEQVLL